MKPNCTHLIKQLFIVLLPTVFIPVAVNAQTIISSANVAVGKIATSSSVESYDHAASKAFDGDTTTRFSSAFTDNEWLAVDLGQMFLVSEVALTWETAYAKDFDILFSRNGSFTDMSEESIQVRNNVLTFNNIAGINTIQAKSNTIARYVRMQGIHRATQFGYSLYEFRVAGSVASAGVLPVTLTGFTATQESNATVLDWATTTEYNTAGFSIERSNDGVNFSAIGWVNGTNGGTVTTHYSYTDKQSSGGKNYYRLKIIALSGATGATPAISISAAGSNGLKAYPIPVKDHFTVEYKGNAGEDINISLFNTAGQAVYNSKQAVKGSLQTMIINRTGNMLPGTYFLTIVSTSNKQYTEQMILQ